MKRFITLITFTQQGASTIQDSPARADEFIETVIEAGGKVNALYWTTGGYDGVLSFDAPDEETATALMVKLASAGNVRTQSLRAHSREDVGVILDKVAKM